MAHKKGHLANVAATQIYSCQQDSETGRTVILAGEQPALWVVEVMWWKSFLEQVQCVCSFHQSVAFVSWECSLHLRQCSRQFDSVTG